MSQYQARARLTFILTPLLVAATPSPAISQTPGVFVRFKTIEPADGQFHVIVSGHRHEDPWVLPTSSADITAGKWSNWLDLSKWPWDARLNRAGGIAEWPSMTVTLSRVGGTTPLKGCSLAVQLADKPTDEAVVHKFTEVTESDTIAFLVPTPLREHANEFETGSQMTARHLAWAAEATAGQPISLKDFTFITALWGHYDPALARKEVDGLKSLGFNIVGNYDALALKKAGLRTYNTIWLYDPDPAGSDKTWAAYTTGTLKAALQTEAGRHATKDAAHFVIGDEVQTMDFRGTDRAKREGWFRDYLRQRGVTDADLGNRLGEVVYPADTMFAKALPKDADLPTRRLLYHAAKFGHWWSARQLRHSSDLIRSSLPGTKTETLPSDHGFFHAWGPPHIGMSYRMLDLFELGAQRSVDQLSAEDWIGLNHMYGPDYTWTGAQSFEYFCAICRSAAVCAPKDEPMLLRTLITVSDDKYLQLKAYSAIGQGIKSFFFWTFGPTYIGTENYWSDLRSEYDGIAKLGRALQQSEEILYDAQPVRDPVAIVYSVSHDIWHSDDPAAFVEKRLLWHALRHLHVQPDFLREEDIEAGRLNDYKVLYISDWCLSRATSKQIDDWVKHGGIVYLSAGAATRDEYYEPFVPPFAAIVWPENATASLRKESHTYNERVDLPTIKPLTNVRVRLKNNDRSRGDSLFELPVLGCQQRLRTEATSLFAAYSDETPAGTMVSYGHGSVIGVGFLPMLAYAQGAKFQREALAEKWPEVPRRIVKLALDAAEIVPAANCDRPVVETSLLSGKNGDALVLVNYTYEPIDALAVDLKISRPVTSASSIAGKKVTLEKVASGIRLHLPLDWTDIIILK
jgi:hypothetical protein